VSEVAESARNGVTACLCNARQHPLSLSVCSPEQAALDDDDDAASAGPMSARPPLSARSRSATPRVPVLQKQVCWLTSNSNMQTLPMRSLDVLTHITWLHAPMQETPWQHTTQSLLLQALGQLDSMPFATARQRSTKASPVLVTTLVQMVSTNHSLLVQTVNMLGAH
jgi:hypothetical protein